MLGLMAVISEKPGDIVLPDDILNFPTSVRAI